MEDPDRPGDHACPHTLVTSIPDGIHKHKHTHNVNRWIEAKTGFGDIPRCDRRDGRIVDRNDSYLGVLPCDRYRVVSRATAEIDQRCSGRKAQLLS